MSRPPNTTTKVPHALFVAVLVAAVALVAAGCGASGPTVQPSAQTPPPQTMSGPGAFATVPLPAGTKPLGRPTTEPTVTSQTFAVTGMSEGALVNFFESALPGAGWATRASDLSGSGVYHGTFLRDAQRLDVVIEKVPDLSSGLPAQFSLLIGPDQGTDPVTGATTPGG